MAAPSEKPIDTSCPSWVGYLASTVGAADAGAGRGASAWKGVVMLAGGTADDGTFAVLVVVVGGGGGTAFCHDVGTGVDITCADEEDAAGEEATKGPVIGIDDAVAAPMSARSPEKPSP